MFFRYLLGADMTLFTTEHMDGGGTEATNPDRVSSFPENNTAPTNQFPIWYKRQMMKGENTRKPFELKKKFLCFLPFSWPVVQN